MNYGIEFEYFVKDKEGKVVPAFEYTNNLDGNPIIGELRTKVHDSIIDCVFELKKLIYEEQLKLSKLGAEMCIISEIKVDDNFLKALRANSKYTNRKQLEVLDDKSIYNKKTGKILPKGLFKSSLQLNISNYKLDYYTYKNDKEVYDSFKYYKSEIFNFVDLIKKLDIEFKEDIINTKRVAGVYAIKKGEMGDRVEYRSLPNIINLDKLINILL